MGGFKRIFVPSSRDDAALVLAAAAESQRVRSLQLITQLPVVVGLDFRSVQPGWNQEHGIYHDVPLDLAGLVPAGLRVRVVGYGLGENGGEMAAGLRACAVAATAVVRKLTEPDA